MSGRAGRGLFALVDDEDADWLSHFSWLFRRQPPNRNRHGKAGARLLVYAHPQRALYRVILEHHGFDLRGKHVRHANGWPFDCRKPNLIVGTRADNSRTLLRPDIHHYQRAIGWAAGGQVYPTAREAVAANDGKRVARKMQSVWRVRVGPRLVGQFDTLEAAQAAHNQAARELGYLPLAEQERLKAELAADLESLVSAGRLVRIDAEYRLAEF